MSKLLLETSQEPPCRFWSDDVFFLSIFQTWPKSALDFVRVLVSIILVGKDLLGVCDCYERWKIHLKPFTTSVQITVGRFFVLWISGLIKFCTRLCESSCKHIFEWKRLTWLSWLLWTSKVSLETSQEPPCRFWFDTFFLLDLRLDQNLHLTLWEFLRAYFWVENAYLVFTIALNVEKLFWNLSRSSVQIMVRNVFFETFFFLVDLRKDQILHLALWEFLFA